MKVYHRKPRLLHHTDRFVRPWWQTFLPTSALALTPRFSLPSFFAGCSVALSATQR